MTNLLVKFFVKDYEDTSKMSVRTAYGVLASGVGIFCNVVLTIVKMLIGLSMQSVSVTADAINNLSDAGSSVIGLVGVKMAEKPADEDHPFGHGRIEYISALIVSFLIIDVGLSFLKESVGKIMNPEALNFSVVSVIILALSIGVKFWLGLFNKKLGKKIDSQVLLATAADSMGDVIATSATVLSLIVGQIAGINIDGYVGIVVSILVMKAGFGIAKDTLEPLLGQPATKEEYSRIKRFVEKYDGIEGSHDLIIHNYGPGRSMASIHAEVPNDVDIEISHEIIDRIERAAAKELGIFLVIHMDPLELRDESVLLIRKQTEKTVAALDEKCSIHDFRIVHGKQQINLIFDLVVPRGYTLESGNALSKQIKKAMNQIDEKYQCVIQVEQSYVEE